ncbi:glycosyltransferase family 2 protein [Candidatus Micrarchaeota archaeon]|nr:glycosyltransferase family 2 protein [Candidatus Micrarchaeota archaeon]
MANSELIIYIPTYNAITTITPLLDRLNATSVRLAKSPDNITVKSIILVNDGSSDNTSDIISKISKKKTSNTPQIILINKKQNKGAVMAVLDGMRKALELADGDNIAKTILVRMDSDLEHQPEDLLKLLQPIKDDRADMVVGFIPFDSRNGFFAELFNRHIGLAESRQFLGLDIPQFCPGFYVARAHVLRKIFPEVGKKAKEFKKIYGKDMIAIDFASTVMAKKLGNRISIVRLSSIEDKWIKKMPLKKLISYLHSHKEIMSFLKSKL